MLLKDFVNKKMASAKKVASAEGVPLTLNNCKKYKKMRELNVYGNCFQSTLPYPYQSVEYIESTSTQYINTGLSVFNNSTYKIELDFMPTGFYDYNIIIGTASGVTTHEAWIYSGGALFFRYNNIKPEGIALTVNQQIKLTLEFDGSTVRVYVNDELKNSYITEESLLDSPMYLLRRDGFFGKDRIYSCKIYTSGNLVRNMVPCYNVETNAIGLYDTINSTFYSNQGSGVFIKGSDILPTPENPIEVQCVGEKSVNLFDDTILKSKGSWTYSSMAADYEGDGVFHVYGEYINDTTSGKNFNLAEIFPRSIKIDSAEYYTLSTEILSIQQLSNYCRIIPYFRTTNGATTSNWINNEINKNVVTGSIISKTYLGGAYQEDAISIDRFWLYFDVPAETTVKYDLRFRVQLQLGKTVTSFEPYGKYKVPIVCRGKNYFSMKKANLPQKIINGITFTPLDDERMRITGKAIDTSVTTVYNQYFAERIPIKAGIYICNYGRSNWDYMYPTQRENQTFLTNINKYGSEMKEDGYIYRFYLGIPKNTTEELDVIIDLLLRKKEGVSGNVPFEPYVEPITTNIFLDEPLRDGDCIDFKNDKIIRNLKGLNLGNLSYTRHKYGSIYLFYAVVSGFDWKYTAGVNGSLETFCEKYSSHTQEYGSTKNYSLFVGNPGFQVNCVGIRDDDYTDVSAFKASLADTLVYYTLAEPKEEPINLDLPKLNAKTTIIEVDTSLTPSNISGKYIIR